MWNRNMEQESGKEVPASQDEGADEGPQGAQHEEAAQNGAGDGSGRQLLPGGRQAGAAPGAEAGEQAVDAEGQQREAEREDRGVVSGVPVSST